MGALEVEDGLAGDPAFSGVVEGAEAGLVDSHGWVVAAFLWLCAIGVVG